MCSLVVLGCPSKSFDPEREIPASELVRMDRRRNPAAHLCVHDGNLMTTAMHASAHGMERKSIGSSHSSLGIVGFRTPSSRAHDGRQANVFGNIAG